MQDKNRAVRRLLAALFWLLVWQAVAMSVGQRILLASPVETLVRLAELAVTGAFWRSVLFTLGHILAGYALAAMLQDDSVVAMLPQPFATVAQTKAQDIRIALDLTHEWDALQAGAETPSTMITGVAVARAAFVEEQPEAVAQFMADYAESVKYVQENVEDAARLIGEFDIFEAGPAQKALPYCNIVFIAGDDMKTRLGGYLAELFAQDPAAVGGALPGEDFYY